MITRVTHTPGPWEYMGECEPIERDPGATAEQIWQSGRVIAEIVTTAEPSIGVAEGWANATLIAAAPELLAALRGLIAQAATDGARAGIRRYYGSDKPLDAALEAAFSAVAKAEGRQ